MIGVVVSVNPRAGTATLVDESNGGIVTNIVIPVSVQGVKKDCVVSYDGKDGIVTAVISYERRPVENILNRPEEYVESDIYNTQQSASQKAGDVIITRPGTGFIALLSNLIAVLGGTKATNITIDGIAKAITLAANTLNVKGDGLDVSLDSSAATPSVRIKIGLLSISSNTTDLLKVQLGDILTYSIDKSGVKINLFGENLATYDIPNKSVLLDSIYEIRAKLVGLVIDTKNMTLNVDGDINVSGQRASITTTKLLALLGQSVAITATSLLRLDGQNIKIRASGNQGVGGSVEIGAGALSGAVFDGYGETTLLGMSCELLGKGEVVANGKNTKAAIEQLYTSMDMLIKIISSAAKAYPLSPLQAVDTVSAALKPTKAYTKNIENKFISVPLIQANGVLK